MMNSFLFVSIALSSLSVSAEEMVILPKVPTAKELEKGVTPLKGGCDQCDTNKLFFNPNSLPKKMAEDVLFLKNKYQCKDGRKRLKNETSFYISSGNISGSSTTIGGTFQPGFLTAGQIRNLYAGVSAFNDLMFVTEVKDSERTVGYNVTFSLCEVPNTFKEYPALVSDSRNIGNFHAPYGITLGKNLECGMGSIVAAPNTSLASFKTEDPHTSDVPIYTSFIGIKCD